jgi:hypothetical protein
VAVHGLKLENRNLGEMKRVYELDIYKLTEALSDIEYVHQQYKSIKAKFLFSNFNVKRLRIIIKKLFKMI